MNHTDPTIDQPHATQAHMAAPDLADCPLVVPLLWAVVVTSILIGLAVIGLGIQPHPKPAYPPTPLQMEHNSPKETFKMLQWEDCIANSKLKHLTGHSVDIDLKSTIAKGIHYN